MKTLRRGKRTGVPLSKRSVQELEREIAAADATIRGLPTSPPRAELAGLIATMEAAADDRKAASGELARREQLRRAGNLAPLRPAARRAAMSKSEQALTAVAAFADAELRGVELVASRLTPDDGETLLQFCELRRAGTLTTEQRSMFEALVGRAADSPSLYQDRREEAITTAKIRAMMVEQRRHPQAASLVAGAMADEGLFDGLIDRHRPDVIEIDPYGQERLGSTGPLYELDSVAALFVVLNLIVANGGRAIELGEHGSVGRELPPLPRGSLSPLALNRWLVLDRSGPRLRIGLGEATRAIAAKWDIALPEAENPSAG